MVLAVAGCGGDDDSSTEATTDTTTKETTKARSHGIVQQEAEGHRPQPPAAQAAGNEKLIEGSGPAAKKGDKVSVDYVGVG